MYPESLAVAVRDKLATPTLFALKSHVTWDFLATWDCYGNSGSIPNKHYLLNSSLSKQKFSLLNQKLACSAFNQRQMFVGYSPFRTYRNTCCGKAYREKAKSSFFSYNLTEKSSKDIVFRII